jgi:hypothetical protein
MAIGVEYPQTTLVPGVEVDDPLEATAFGGGALTPAACFGGVDDAVDEAVPKAIWLAAGHVRLPAIRNQPGPAPPALSQRITLLCGPFCITHHTRG